MGIPNKTTDPQGPRRNSHGVYSAPTGLLRQAAPLKRFRQCKQALVRIRYLIILNNWSGHSLLGGRLPVC